MKFVFGLCLMSIIARIQAEVCTINTDCTSTTCSTGNTIICQHPDGQGITQDGGLCTCSAAAQCISQSDCFGSSFNLSCPNSQRHCYDNNCICSRFPVGK